MDFSFKAIAKVTQCSFKEKFGTPRQGCLTPESRAFLKLSPKLPAGATEGLEGFSYLWLLWVFHENTNTKVKGKVFAPRLDGASTGVLASRSPHRPNPIGLSRVKLESVEGEGLWVSGIDLIEDTPILDIKPFIQEDQLSADEFESAELGWPSMTTKSIRNIVWEFNLRQCMDHWTSEQLHNFTRLVESTLRLDPRPVVYKRLEEQQGYDGPYGLTLGFENREYNIQFTSNAQGFVITKIEEKI